MRFRLLFTAMLLVIFAPSARAHHEHLFSLPSAADIVAALPPNWRNVSLSKIQDDISGWRDLANPKSVVSNLFGEQVSKAVAADRNGSPTLGELFETIAKVTGASQAEVERTFFEVTPLSHGSTREAFFNRVTYQSNEFFRGGIFRYFGTDTNIAIFENYLRRHDALGRIPEVFHLSTSDSSTRKPELLNKLSALFHSHGSEVVFYGSIPRRFLLSEAQTQASLDHYARNPALYGIDLTGSLHEVQLPPGVALRALRQTFGAAALAGKAVRVHIFEGKNRSVFNDEFWQVVEELSFHPQDLARIPEIRIGHIAALDPKLDVARFDRLDPALRKKLIFEANPASNAYLRFTPPRALAERIVALHRKGFRVVVGGDGAGILDYKLAETLKTLAYEIHHGPGVTETEANSIVDALLKNTVTSSADFPPAVRARREALVAELAASLRPGKKPLAEGLPAPVLRVICDHVKTVSVGAH